ncbi:hypothetical protein evm_003977 [Chilo suppressalis]|nr:hypothetical protein evm_003977 [Chilo suppressalis]
MSEEIDLNTNNLCTTEDAFEKFQSVSMYEEDEFITLSDIVSPRPTTSELAIDLNDIPYENEIELESQLEEQVPEVNSTIELGSEENKNVSEYSHVPEETLIKDSSIIVTESKPKRGRKKKTQQSESILTVNQTQNEQSCDQQSIFVQDDKNCDPSAPVPKRRGRKPKQNVTKFINYNSKTKASLQHTNILDDNTEVMPESLSSTIPPNSGSENENTSVALISRRRPGRPRKRQVNIIPPEQQMMVDGNTELNVSDIKEESCLNISDESILLSKNRRRGRRVSAKNTCQEDLGNVTIEPTSEQSVEQIANNNVEEPIKRKKSPKKRRKIRKHQEGDTTPNDLAKAEIATALSEDEDDLADDICLSKLKETFEPSDSANLPNNVLETEEVVKEKLGEIVKEETEEMVKEETEEIEKVKTEEFVKEETLTTESTPINNSDITTTADIELNVEGGDKVVKNEMDINEIQNKEDLNDSLLIEDTTKRPMRRKARKTFHYEQDSDEDPFANVELSDDDEPKKGKKGGKYYSDDEYIPGGSKRGPISSSECTDSDIDAEVDELITKQRRKKQRLNSSMEGSPKKRGRKPKYEKQSNDKKPSLEVETITPEASFSQEGDDIEICLQSSLIKASDDSKQNMWGKSNEFENFIAKRIQGTDIKIKKASMVQPLEIPVIDPNDVKKTVETSMQTTQIKTASVEVQTSAPHDIPMKDNVPLTSEQAEKACEFLKGIVKTTAELGELMTKKSEDFITKKINTSHVTDTFKMDYCVRKSFLLFKLAKHNLMQMEEDLSKQYDQFLNENNLMQYREKPKVITATKKPDDNDSDCEIIEAPIVAPAKQNKGNSKPKFNPKTVFLNKELSIKIAKKPSDEKKLQIKGRHTVWINDSVMVKKVKPTQSFLAQDSRNKKPPDYVTIEMVNSFFKKYQRKQALITCAPFITTEWLSFNRQFVCSYFFTKTEGFPTSSVPEMPTERELDTNTETMSTSTKNICCQQSNIENKVYCPRSLFSLCAQIMQNQLVMSTPKPCKKTVNLYSSSIVTNELNFKKFKIVGNCLDVNVLPLKTLCFESITKFMGILTCNAQVESNVISPCFKPNVEITGSKLCYVNKVPSQDVESLFSLCLTFVQNQFFTKMQIESPTCIKHTIQKNRSCPKTLKNITFKFISNIINENNPKLTDITTVKTLSCLCFEVVTKYFSDIEGQTPKESLTINSINRLTEEAYFNMEEPTDLTDNIDYYADDDTNFYEDETEDNDFNNFDEINDTEDNNWISQLEMKELRSIPSKVIETTRPIEEENAMPVVEEATVARIKIEPEEEPEQIVNSLIKTEPLHNLDEMTVIPESFMTNSLSNENDLCNDQARRKDSASYDVESFETFVKSNKLMRAFNEQDDASEVYSQSASRIRRQFEPDWEPENDMAMSLLVPQTFEPLHIENAKDRLMESSGDESNNTKKPANKKKTDKRKAKVKKVDTKSDKQTLLEKSTPKEIPKEKQPVSQEIAVLTRRMREKIRQEEKKIASSDSETESGKTISKKAKEIDSLVSKKTKEIVKDVSKVKQKSTKLTDEEIQCNNVDSTEQVTEQMKCYSPDPNSNQFTGFSAVDQNEVFNYQKYIKYVYDKILPTVNDDEKRAPETDQPVINPNEPVELLECEPTMPVFNMQETISPEKAPNKEVINKKSAEAEDIPSVDINDKPLPYKLRHGWQCYPLQTDDTKLYQAAQIVLEKLPESFVNTYFAYQNISNKDKEDEEVDRLINLQSLNRPVAKEGRCRGRPKKLKPPDQTLDKIKSENDDSRPVSPVHSEHYQELTPSEDENVGDDVPSPPKKRNATENSLAKSSLMDDNDSEDESNVKIKKELTEEAANESKLIKKSKPGPKSKCKPAEPIDSESMMLTADKMMNRELNLLHAPIVLDEEPQKTQSKGPVTRNKQHKGMHKSSNTKRNKDEEGGSSSEEEKHQWFTIKEKLLKKMINKKDTTREDDAKRAKLVSEFIERRGDLAEHYLKRRKVRGRRSTKKMLERQKQLRVLSQELFGGASNDASHTGKGRNSSYFKGRRNIRKVLDKKSLAKSTVLANMEEFERKRRLNIRQNKLREILGYEEGVNVLVINDEVCLEYDFEQRLPVVTIHSFFTKVMKAHQYEGVKFMWDACFESLNSIESGHPGGGCILAHCMGLGKTLQVLALLHTVLTHPRVGMQRVLVCCPLSTVLNWVDEIHKWIGPVTDQIKVFELSKLKKTYERAYQLEDWYKGGGIFIIGYELFRSLTTLDPFLDDVRPVIVNKIRNALLDPGPDIIICDEGHLLKNDSSVLAVAMSRVRTSRRIVLTGTPMQNNLREYYCMVNFVKPNLLGTYAEYSNRFENPIMNGQHRDSREEDIKLMKARTHILHKVLEGCLQRQEASVLYPYLPKKHEYTVFVSMSQCQWDLYKHYLQNCTSTQSNKSNVLKDFHILQKIWSHPQVLHNFSSRTRDDLKTKVKLEKLEDDLAREDLNAEDIKPASTDTWWLQYLEGGNMLDSLHSSNKFVTVFRILEECIALGDKLLIFSTSLFTMDALEYFLKKIKDWSLGKEYYRLDGSVPAEVRQKWCREFNSDQNVNTKLFLISTRAGCLGLNMTAANRVIILDTSWNPAHDIQSIFRVYRFGQKKDCYIYRLVALGTMEQKIYERSVTKQAVACRVVDEQQIDRHYNMADLTELYKYDDTGLGVASGVAVGVQDVALLRVARDTNLHAVHEHDSLLRGSGEQGLPEHERHAAWLQFQQEHAHKQMQDEHDYTKTDGVKPPVKTEKSENNGAVPEVKAERRGRPRKNGPVVSCYIPIEPQQSLHTMPIDKNREEELVEKITHMLIKHNFHVRQEPQEIANLVSNVRRIIANGVSPSQSGSDDLSGSIASLLLQNELPMPQLTNIVCESVNNTIATEPSASSSSSEISQPTISIEKPLPKLRIGRPKGKRKPNFVYEEIKPRETEKVVNESSGRKRRRAALEAEKSFDTITDSNVDLGDGSDTEFIPEGIVVAAPTAEVIVDDNISVKQEPTDNPVRNNRRVAAEANSKKDSTQPSTVIDSHSKILHDQVNSILLSDDDEPPKRKRPGPARKTLVTKPQETEASETSEKPVPLHPSLLSNQNFIKIVAHTYLTGNPMLDEDAATLAAQYSTQKALKEFESTGKNIESGPLYDIAVQVLGVDILKKLQSSKGNTVAKPVQTPVAVEKPPEPRKVLPVVKPKEEPKETPKETPREIIPESIAGAPAIVDVGTKMKSIKLKIRMPTEGSKDKPIVTLSNMTPQAKTAVQTPAIIVPTSTVKGKSRIRVKPGISNSVLPKSVPQLPPMPQLLPAPTANVVPVGLFKGAADINTNDTHQSADECILPDDDDIHIISDPVPQLNIAQEYQQRPMIPVTPISEPAKSMRYVLEMPVNSVRSDSSTVNANEPRMNQFKIQIPKNAAHKVVKLPSRTSINTAPATSESIVYNTISLDSDDDDDLPNVPLSQLSKAAPPSVVPVSLTASNLLNVGSQPLVPVSLTTANSIIQHTTDLTNVLNVPATSATRVSQGQPPKVVNKKYIVVPSSSLKLAGADLPTKVVPIALSRASTAVPQNPTSVPETESILPVATPENDVTAKKKLTKGDVFRVYKSGQVELLTRRDQTPPAERPKQSLTPANNKSSSAVPATSHSSPNSSLAPVVSTAPASTVTIDLEEISKPSKKKSNSQALVNKESCSSNTNASNSSTSSSPFDPLSILRDVVHIEADDYTVKRTSNIVTKENIVKKKDTVASTKIETISSKAPLKNNKKTYGSVNKVLSHKDTKTITKADDKQTKGQTSSATSKPILNLVTPPIAKKIIPLKKTTKKSEIFVVKASDNKKKVHTLNNTEETVIDITCLDEEPTTSTDKNKTKTKKVTGSTLTGNSKDIILCGSGKAIKRSSTSTRSVEIVKHASVTPEPAPPAPSPSPKKKKTDKLMTLKDFDIDDIDDIIELD